MEKPTFPAIRVWTAEEVKEIRAVLNYNQTKFGRLFPVEAATVRAWEAGRRNPYGPSSSRLQELKLYTDHVIAEKDKALARIIKQ